MPGQPLGLTMESATMGQHPHSTLTLRAFGWQAADIEVDFNQSSRPKLITELLLLCQQQCPPWPEEAVWQLLVNERLKLLLQLLQVSQPGGITVKLTCRPCTQLMELTFSEQELVAQIEQYADPVMTVMIGEQAVPIQRPRGDHQRTWQQQSFSDEQTATRFMIKDLLHREVTPVIERRLHEQQVLDSLDQELSQADPMMAFNLTTTCPYCGQEQIRSIDWEVEVLKRLHRLQQELLKAVHQLAKHYHWEEQRILALPHWRRQHYLNLLAREK